MKTRLLLAMAASAAALCACSSAPSDGGQSGGQAESAGSPSSSSSDAVASCRATNESAQAKAGGVSPSVTAAENAYAKCLAAANDATVAGYGGTMGQAAATAVAAYRKATPALCTASTAAAGAQNEILSLTSAECASAREDDLATLLLARISPPGDAAPPVIAHATGAAYQDCYTKLSTNLGDPVQAQKLLTCIDAALLGRAAGLATATVAENKSRSTADVTASITTAITAAMKAAQSLCDSAFGTGDDEFDGANNFLCRADADAQLDRILGASK